MRALRVLVVVMGVLIVVGTVGLVVAVVYRATPRSAPIVAARQPDVVLDEPAGTRMVGLVGGVDTVVLRLEGGGPDRLLVLDARTGSVVRRVGLAR